MANSAKIGKNACGICNLPTGHANSSGTLEDLVKLPCNHIFRDKCISAWLKAQEYGHCPTCHVDCAKDFVDTWRLLKETARAGESLGAGVKEEGGDEHVEATSFGGLETAKLDVEDNSAEDQTNDDAEVEGLEMIAEVSAEDEASGNEVEELEGTDNVEFADETEESIEGAEGAVQDIIDEGFIDEDITLVADIGVANDFKNGAVAEAVLADEGLTKEALEEEAVEELAVDTEANDESTAQEEVAGENPADETAGENGGGPTWGTAQENPELQAARCLHFFRTHGYGDQYRTELEASRNAAGRSTRNMVSAFNVKAHPLPEGGERALVSKNIQVWAKYLHALKLKSLDELKTTRSRKFRVDIAGWYAKQREDFFEQLDKNLESQNQDGPDVDAVEVAEHLLKTGDAEKIKELESILAYIHSSIHPSKGLYEDVYTTSFHQITPPQLKLSR
ncbi:hypothetical protein EG327_004963 [Venturia inaequalis]|uniref:RING-type domain-containing protein n=1 Tax=Venturia inaequalis TaxID=5025 RepID=A0A8H3VCW2_VENIN|nr:hypothetical protein EG327_004963 [Venturia inaequalis]